MFKIFAVVVVFAAGAICQDSTSNADFTHAPALDLLGGSAAVSASDASYTPLTFGEKYLISLHRTVAPADWAGFALRSTLDQLWSRPVTWGSGPQSFGIQMASHFGLRLLNENLAFGVRAIDHEDPRYFRLGHGSVWRRTRFAIVHTFAVRNDNGSEMPAYSLFFASFATPAIAHEWRPGPFNPHREMGAGSIGVSVGIAESVWREFAPDLRQHLPRRIQRLLPPNPE